MGTPDAAGAARNDGGPQAGPTGGEQGGGTAASATPAAAPAEKPAAIQRQIETPAPTLPLSSKPARVPGMLARGQASTRISVVRRLEERARGLQRVNRFTNTIADRFPPVSKRYEPKPLNPATAQRSALPFADGSEGGAPGTGSAPATPERPPMSAAEMIAAAKAAQSAAAVQDDSITARLHALREEARRKQNEQASNIQRATDMANQPERIAPRSLGRKTAPPAPAARPATPNPNVVQRRASIEEVTTPSRPRQPEAPAPLPFDWPGETPEPPARTAQREAEPPPSPPVEPPASPAAPPTIQRQPEPPTDEPDLPLRAPSARGAPETPATEAAVEPPAPTAAPPAIQRAPEPSAPAAPPTARVERPGPTPNEAAPVEPQALQRTVIEESPDLPLRQPPPARPAASDEVTDTPAAIQRAVEAPQTDLPLREPPAATPPEAPVDRPRPAPAASVVEPAVETRPTAPRTPPPPLAPVSVPPTPPSTPPAPIQRAPEPETPDEPLPLRQPPTRPAAPSEIPLPAAPPESLPATPPLENTPPAVDLTPTPSVVQRQAAPEAPPPEADEPAPIQRQTEELPPVEAPPAVAPDVSEQAAPVLDDLPLRQPPAVQRAVALEAEATPEDSAETPSEPRLTAPAARQRQVEPALEAEPRAATPGTPVPEPPAPLPQPSLEAQQASLPLRVPPAAVDLTPAPPVVQRQAAPAETPAETQPETQPARRLTMGQRLQARSEQNAELPVSRAVSLIQRQMARRVIAHNQAATRAAERQGLPAPLPRGTIQRAKDPYKTWQQDSMQAQGLGQAPVKKFSMHDLFQPDPHKLPKGFVPFDQRTLMTDPNPQLTTATTDQPTTTPVVDSSGVIPLAPPLTPTRRSAPSGGPRPRRGPTVATTDNDVPPPLDNPPPLPLDLPLVPPTKREYKPVKLRTTPMKFLEDNEAPPPPPKPEPEIRTRKRSGGGPLAPIDPALQQMWRDEAAAKEAKEEKEREAQLKNEQELDELRKQLAGGSRGSDVDIPDLARRVYPLIRRLLLLDRERR